MLRVAAIARLSFMLSTGECKIDFASGSKYSARVMISASSKDDPTT